MDQIKTSKVKKRLSTIESYKVPTNQDGVGRTNIIDDDSETIKILVVIQSKKTNRKENVKQPQKDKKRKLQRIKT